MWDMTAVTVAQNLREDGSLSPEYTYLSKREASIVLTIDASQGYVMINRNQRDYRNTSNPVDT